MNKKEKNNQLKLFLGEELRGNLNILIDPKKKDSFSDGRVQCSDCNLSIGNESDWGSPGLDTRNKLTEMWNNLKR